MQNERRNHMTLKRYLKKRGSPNVISILMYDENGLIFLPQLEYRKEDYANIDKNLLKMEVMEIVVEDDLVEVYVM